MASIGSTRVSHPRPGIVFACLLLGAAARGELLPPEGARSLPQLIVSGEQDARHDLRSIAAGAPTLLLPIFTRCTGTCPMTAALLKRALEKAQAPFRVIVFSFDEEDTARDLREFRERFALPPAWLVVRSGDAAATRAFLDGLDFHFMKSGGGFDHPNETFAFSPKGAWAATFTGVAFPAAELETAWRRAKAADDPSAIRRAGAWLIRPEAWILLACTGLAVSLAALMFVRTNRS